MKLLVLGGTVFLSRAVARFVRIDRADPESLAAVRQSDG
jgi:hypothetical protein